MIQRRIAGSVRLSRVTVRAYLGLGANLGDPAATLAWAVEALDALPEDPGPGRLAAVP